jgi:hypothetical protein
MKPIDTTGCLEAARAGYISVTTQWVPMLPPFPFTRLDVTVVNNTWLNFTGGGSASVLVEPGTTPQRTAWVYGRQLALRRIRDAVRDQETALKP